MSGKCKILRLCKFDLDFWIQSPKIDKRAVAGTRSPLDRPHLALQPVAEIGPEDVAIDAAGLSEGPSPLTRLAPAT